MSKDQRTVQTGHYPGGWPWDWYFSVKKDAAGQYVLNIKLIARYYPDNKDISINLDTCVMKAYAAGATNGKEITIDPKSCTKKDLLIYNNCLQLVIKHLTTDAGCVNVKDDLSMYTSFISCVQKKIDELPGVEIPENADAPIADSPIIVSNYPNPFSGSTVITTSNSADKSIVRTVRVSDLLGREVKTLTIPAGSSSVEFDAAGLSKGIYIYTVISDQASAANKMLLIK